MKSVLISIKPKYCAMIANGEKTVELRKNRPKLKTPFKCYIYCTLAGSNEFFKNDLHGDVVEWHRGKWATKKGMVIGEFICDRLEPLRYGQSYNDGSVCPMISVGARLKAKELNDYAKGKTVYGWHISDLKIYDKPEELGDFRKPEMPLGLRYEDDKVKKPPQSWCYVEAFEEERNDN